MYGAVFFFLLSSRAERGTSHRSFAYSRASEDQTDCARSFTSFRMTQQ